MYSELLPNKEEVLVFFSYSIIKQSFVFYWYELRVLFYCVVSVKTAIVSSCCFSCIKLLCFRAQ